MGVRSASRIVAKTKAGNRHLKCAIKEQPMWPKVSRCSGTINEAAAPKGGCLHDVKRILCLGYRTADY